MCIKFIVQSNFTYFLLMFYGFTLPITTPLSNNRSFPASMKNIGTFLILHLMTSYTIETYTKSTTPSIDCVYVPRITYKLIRNHLNRNPDRFHGNQPGYCYILCIYKCIKLYVYFHTHTTSFSISHPQNIHTSYIHRTSTILNNMIYPFGDEQTRIFFFGKN